MQPIRLRHRTAELGCPLAGHLWDVGKATSASLDIPRIARGKMDVPLVQQTRHLSACHEVFRNRTQDIRQPHRRPLSAMRRHSAPLDSGVVLGGAARSG
jgi:hypothetical protein